MGYFAQHAMDVLDGDRTVFQQLEYSFPQAGQAPLRALAGCLRLFRRRNRKEVPRALGWREGASGHGA